VHSQKKNPKTTAISLWRSHVAANKQAIADGKMWIKHGREVGKKNGTIQC
jgi:hypothetical protein